MTPDLGVIPHEQTHLVVIGTSLRKNKTILDAYFRSLEWQILPRNVKPFYLFVDDGLEPDALAAAQAFVQLHGGQLVSSGNGANDFSDNHPVTHQWSDSAMARVGQNKDYILAWARENRAEAVWFADSDLIMDPMTLTSLWSIPDQIVCGVYWTRWQRNPSEMNPVHAGPQVWQRHPYDLNGNGMDEWELRRDLINRQIVPVYGQGACTLIRRVALAKGVSFAPMPGNTGPGLMQGEDRHFCIRAAQLHIRMVADGWPDIFHIYHRPDDEALIPEMQKRLESSISGARALGAVVGEIDHPVVGDLVSLELCALEPIEWQHQPVQYVRGRLGKLGLMPELEDAVLQMERDQTMIVPVHFGLDYALPPYRGERRLIRVKLIDHKPMGFAPVIDQEVFVNSNKSWLDTTTFPPETIELMREVHA